MIQAVFAGEALELIPIGVYVVDAQGVIQHYNRRAAELWGVAPTPLDPEQRYCGPLRMLRSDGSILANDQCPVAETLRTGKPSARNLEVFIERPDGSRRTVAVNVGPLHDGAGQLIGAINFFDDITEHQLVAENLLRAKEAAEAANAAKDQFLAALSHELRTPLAPVLMTATALEKDTSIPQRVRKDLALIRRNIELEARLIDDLLDLTRVARGKLELHCEAVDAHVLLQETLQTCCGSDDFGSKRLTIATNLRAKNRFVWADSARLSQIFWNLIRNAIKFTCDGGRVEVTTADLPDERMAVTIRDSGVGIDPELLPRIFDAFEQGSRITTRRFGGLGLGLAISKALVDMHRGRISAESDGPGRGATFTLELPVMRVPKPRRRTPEKTQSAQRGLRILLVEDHEMTARVLERLLRGMNYDVATAGTVQHALATAQSGSFDLLISDLGLPDGSGLDLMRELQQIYKIKGIALSGYGMEEDIRRSREVGFAAHLTKPVSIEKLQATINQVA